MVRTVFDNRGAESLAAPSPDSPSPFAYFLQSQKEGGPIYGLSESITDRRRSPDRVGAPQLETQPLAAGGKLERQEDIADFWSGGFEPGKYSLTVRYDAGDLESPRSVVTILPLVAESFSSFVSETHLSSVVAHRRQDGQITLLQRESEVRDPNEGVFLVRRLLPQGGAVGVATAIDVVPAGNGRWFAWARDGKLTAINGGGNRVFATTEPVPAPGALLSPGFQVAVGTALFGAVSPAGRLETYLATAAGLKKHWSSELGTAAGKVLWNAQPDGSVTVAWEDSTSGRVLRRSFAPDGQPRDAAPQVGTPGRPIAWGLPATGPPVLWAVVADGAAFVLARIPVAGDRSLTRLPELSGATAWDFDQAAQGASAVVAVAEGKIYRSPMTNPAWLAVRDAPRAQALHIVSLNGRALWAEWIEAGFGIRRVKLP
jgi:hypothetical protein